MSRKVDRAVERAAEHMDALTDSSVMSLDDAFNFWHEIEILAADRTQMIAEDLNRRDRK